MSVALNGGLRVIQTSAVLRTVKNSRIKACVHWENANWRKPLHTTPHHTSSSSSLLFTSRTNTLSTASAFCTPSEWKARSVICRPVGARLRRPLCVPATQLGHTAANICVFKSNFPTNAGAKFLFNSFTKVRCVIPTRCESCFYI